MSICCYFTPVASPGHTHFHRGHRSQLPPGQSFQTTSQPGGRTCGSFLIQVKLALWHGQIGHHGHRDGLWRNNIKCHIGLFWWFFSTFKSTFSFVNSWCGMSSFGTFGLLLSTQLYVSVNQTFNIILLNH